VLARVPEARVVFLGQGSGLATVEQLASDLPEDAVRVLGSVSPEECARWLRGAAGALVSIVPGRGYDFAVPTKVFAALATGAPVLYAGVGPVAEILADRELGAAVPYDVDAIAEAMVAMLNGSEEPGVEARRSAWVEANRSLAAVAERAAGAVLAVVGRKVS